MVYDYSNEVREDVDKNAQIGELEILQKVLTQPFIITVLNYEGKVIDVNENFIATFNYSLPELKFKEYGFLISGYHSEEFMKGVWSSIRSGNQWSGELCHRAKKGEMIWLKSTIVSIEDNEDSKVRYMMISTNITEQKAMEKWRHLAYHHELTNLPNRRMLEPSMQSYIASAEQKDKQLAILYMDIDRFKEINDTYGYLTGDLLLREVGSRLAGVTTLNNCIFHVSGDEFILIIKEIENLGAHIKLIMNLFNKPFIIEKHQIKASISIGVSLYPDHGTDSKRLIAYADLAMFDAKGTTGNTYCEYKPSMNG